MYVCTILPRITARVFISLQRFLTRPLNETDDYYQKKHMLFIICDASNEFLMEADDTWSAILCILLCYSALYPGHYSKPGVYTRPAVIWGNTVYMWPGLRQSTMWPCECKLHPVIFSLISFVQNIVSQLRKLQKKAH